MLELLQVTKKNAEDHIAGASGEPHISHLLSSCWSRRVHRRKDLQHFYERHDHQVGARNEILYGYLCSHLLLVLILLRYTQNICGDETRRGQECYIRFMYTSITALQSKLHKNIICNRNQFDFQKTETLASVLDLCYQKL